MSNQELACPSTGEACAFYHFCASEKENQEEGGYSLENPIGKKRANLPKRVIEAMDNSFCSNARIQALSELAVDKTVGPVTQVMAERRAQDSIQVRENFPTQHN